MSSENMRDGERLAARTERSATVADVARLADVSTAAVSFYFSSRQEHLKRVGPEARERIRAAVEELGYIQNKTARHLRRQQSERICIVLPKLGIPYADKMVHDLGSVAAQQGLLPIVLTGSTIGAVQKILGEVEAGLADGVIAEVGFLTEEQVEQTFAPFNRPCLVIHPTAQPRSYSVLNSGLIDALECAFDDLLHKGHRDFAYIQNAEMQHNPRISALKARAVRSGLSVLITTMVGADAREATAGCARNIAEMAKRPTAVLLDSDYTAVTLIEEFARLGIQVPSEIAVVGCGNAEEGFYCNPRLTTIGPEWLSLLEAGQHLIDSLSAQKPLEAKAFYTPWRFIVRESA
ncbi:LacI family DNA-binding transcriptional regulator [Rhizobium sp. SEMIA 4085]|uniref:LacI family DNA-binding transcriptional regulator n=1 Tax=Rhizobium sp. SEMIA 4085 TaxID=2137761 RepID=UPI0014783B68|nr:LacI family DNA-binding transcriptional regulator [Rhizobium sp. SEMIA 4085]NNH29763.1 LacI family DNA-binding transcriptional regulator [Rhizobium sp. SEMIA 4085]